MHGCRHPLKRRKAKSKPSTSSLEANSIFFIQSLKVSALSARYFSYVSLDVSHRNIIALYTCSYDSIRPPTNKRNRLFPLFFFQCVIQLYFMPTQLMLLTPTLSQMVVLAKGTFILLQESGSHLCLSWRVSDFTSARDVFLMA